MLERETKTLFSRDQRDIQMIRASIYATNQKEEGSTRQITANLIGGGFGSASGRQTAVAELNGRETAATRSC